MLKGIRVGRLDVGLLSTRLRLEDTVVSLYPLFVFLSLSYAHRLVAFALLREINWKEAHHRRR